MAERRMIQVGGIVQGVGFRPFVHGLASRLKLSGFVRNVSGDVLIEVEGEPRALEQFLEGLTAQPPPLAQIERVSCQPLPSVGDDDFRIAASEVHRSSRVLISPDVATCDQCLGELLDATDRRFRYPFLNCTNCGPRLTIVTGAPYDRAQTTMASFRMCPACQAEYDDPGNRRFHAQPTACADCGPALCLLSPSGEPISCAEPLTAFAAAIASGQIGAMKGLGGYHLACDARHEAAVGELRRRKHRDEKPLALMVRDIHAAETICHIDHLEQELLLSWRSPIVLLRRRRVGEIIAKAVAPGNPYLGVMLPYTPLHHLLFRQLGDIPLVMTSGNRSDEPIVSRDAEAVERLGGIADLLLVHNRPIHVRCDDSVTRVVAGAELPLRRSRGYAPQPIRLPQTCPCPILAVGGQLKGTFALGRDAQAILSHHLGDLDDYEAYRAFEKDVALYQQLFDIHPECIAHDHHPDYASTRYAQNLAFPIHAEKVRLVPVQHHHAHMASCMAENGLVGPVIGVAFDGTGLGTDMAIWGGEFLVGDYAQFQRAAHLRYVSLPGGEQAIREPWRMAVAHLLDTGLPLDILYSRVAPSALQIVAKMVERQLNTALTSSMGRLFDAVAALIGVRDRANFEGQAAMELEWRAAEAQPQTGYPWTFTEAAGAEEPEAAVTPPFVIDTRPLIRAVVDDVHRAIDRHIIARRFHATIVEIIAHVCERIRARTGLDRVVLSGGVFMNALLTDETMCRLSDAQFDVYRHHLVPPNDGGLSLGQLAIAAAVLQASP